VSLSIDRIRSDTGLIVPDGSILEHFGEPERLIDPIWVAKVIVPISSYESFKQDILSRTDDHTILSGSLADTTSWWNPSNIVLTKQYLHGSQTFVRVVVSKENEEIAAYIECVVF